MIHLIILGVLPFIIAIGILEEAKTPDNYSFYQNVCVMDKCNVHLFIVDSWEDYPPERCQYKNVRGCSLSGFLSDDYIYIVMPLYIDEWGMNTFEHEVAHIICECSFHATAELREALRYEENVFDFIIEHKEDIQRYINNFT